MIHGTIMAIVYCVDVGTGNPVDLIIANPMSMIEWIR